MICSSTWQDMPSDVLPTGNIDWQSSDANTDNILAHECQHGSDLRVCFTCVARYIEIKLIPPSGAWMEHIGPITYIVLDDIARAAWYTKTGEGI